MADDVATPQVPTPVQTLNAPKEGLRTSLIEWKFTATVQNIETDFYQQITNAALSAVRCLYVDNADNAQPVTIFFLESQQRVVIPAKAQVYVPVLTATSCTTLAQSTGAVTVRVHAMNFVVPPFFLGPKSGGSGGATISLTDEGGAPFAAGAIDFQGLGVTMTPGAGSQAIVSIPGPMGMDEGTALGRFTSINFVGAGVVASGGSPGQLLVTIPGTSTPVAVLDEGSQVVAVATAINFVGGGVQATGAGGVATVTVPAPQIQAQFNGTPVVTSGAFNFTGAATVTNVGGVATVNVSAGSIAAQQGGVSITPAMSIINFIGLGVNAVLASPGVVNVTIPSGGVVKATTMQTLTASGTYNTPANCTRIIVRMRGGGGAGGPSGNTAGGASTAGGDTLFNGIAAKGGDPGLTNGMGGAGGRNGAGAARMRVPGLNGSSMATAFTAAGSASYSGGDGGGPGAGMGNWSNAVWAGLANTGSGGAGAEMSGTFAALAAAANYGGGGGQGEYAEFVIDNPAASYAFTIGAGGVGGAAGTGGNPGSPGGSGIIWVEESYGAPASGYVGTQTNDNAPAGIVGEYAQATGGVIGLANGVYANACSLPLTAGDWDVQAAIRFGGNTATTVGYVQQSLSLTSGTADAAVDRVSGVAYGNATGTPFNQDNINLPPIRSRFSLAAPATVYLVGVAAFGVAGCQFSASKITARRVR